MTVEWAEVVVGAVGIYVTMGLVFAVAFITRGLASIDRGATSMPWRVRLLIAPGTVALWPLMAWKWRTQTSPPLS